MVNSFPNIKREYIKELRAILYDSRKNGLYNAAVKYIKKNKNEKIINRNNGDNFEERIIQWFMEVLKGKINFLKQVRGEKDYVFLKYAKEFNDLFGIDLFDVSIIDELLNKVSKNIFIVKGINDNNMNQGSGFFVKGYGIFTNYHVTEDEDFYGVYKYDEPNKFIATISKGMNEKKSDKDIDYALYEYNKKDNNCFEIDVNGTLDIGDKVKIIGYPNYNEGDLPSIQTCEIISRKDNFFGAPLYIVGGRIVHGASGGPVLNSKDKIIGIIKGGIVSYEEEQDNHNQGFIPIDIVLKNLEKEKVLCSD